MRKEKLGAVGCSSGGDDYNHCCLSCFSKKAEQYIHAATKSVPYVAYKNKFMTTDNKRIWIETGYSIFAASGQAGLKVEPLAQAVGKSKSSFYHHFADMDLFMDYLLQHHLKQSAIIGQKENSASCVDPELISILVEHQTDLLFNRHLRIHRNISSFNTALQQSDKIVGNAFVKVWAKEMNLNMPAHKIESITTLALENFYLQINENNINHKWLSSYFAELKKITTSLL